MAVYTDSELNDRIDATLPTNHAGAIDAAELKALLKDINDSKLNAAASFGSPVRGTINADDLVDGAITVTHDLDTDFPVLYIKSGVGDIWSEIHFTQSAVGSNDVLITFEDDLAAGSAVEYIVVKFA
jgi:hypothetical protein